MDKENLIVTRTLPVNLSKNDYGFFEKEIVHEIQKPSILEIDNAFITSRGIVFKKFRLVKESLVSGVTINIGILFLLKQFLLKRNIPIKNTYPAIAFDFWFNGYFHWITETLPRVLWLKKSGLNFSLVIPATQSDFVIKSIEPFNINSIVSISEDNYIFTKRALLINHTAPTGNYNEHLIKELRSLFRSYYATYRIHDCWERIYVSRKKSNRRKVINEKEVATILESYGFKTVCFEDYPFEQQVRISLNAKFLIGVHGAGLTNMIFMNEGASVFEFRHLGDDSNLCYFSLASALKLKYYYQFCKYFETHANINNDMNIDINELKNNVELMLLEN